MTTKALILHNAELLGVSVESSIALHKKSVLEKSAAITVVTAESLQTSANSMRDIKGLMKLVEDSRQEVKAPILEIGRKIDEAAKNFVAELSPEFKRLDGLLIAFNTEQQRIADAARKAEVIRQLEEEQRQQAEARRVAAAAEAERQRVAAEADRVAEVERQRQAELARLERERVAAEEASFLTESEEDKRVADERAALVEKARLEAERAAEVERVRIADEARLRAQEAETERQRVADENARRAEESRQAFKLAQAAMTVAKPTGVTITDEWTFEVLDLKQLAQNWQFVRCEANISEINSAIKAGVREIPGLRIFNRPKTITR